MHHHFLLLLGTTVAFNIKLRHTSQGRRSRRRSGFILTSRHIDEMRRTLIQHVIDFLHNWLILWRLKRGSKLWVHLLQYTWWIPSQWILTRSLLSWRRRDSCILFIRVCNEGLEGVLLALRSSPVFDMVKICVGLIVIQYWDFASDGGGDLWRFNRCRRWSE